MAAIPQLYLAIRDQENGALPGWPPQAYSCPDQPPQPSYETVLTRRRADPASFREEDVFPWPRMSRGRPETTATILRNRTNATPDSRLCTRNRSSRARRKAPPLRYFKSPLPDTANTPAPGLFARPDARPGPAGLLGSSGRAGALPESPDPPVLGPGRWR